MQKLKTILVSADGQGMVEYALIIGLIAVVVVVTLFTLAGGVNNMFETINNVVPS